MFSSIGLPNAVKLLQRPTFVFFRLSPLRFFVLPGDRVGLLRIPLVETWGVFYSWPWDLQVWETPSWGETDLVGELRVRKIQGFPVLLFKGFVGDD